MNSSSYSCYDGRELSYDSVTVKYWDISEEDIRPAALASAILTFSFILVGLPSNILIIVSILWQNLYREPTYMLLLNLAFANLMMCIFVMPFTVVSGFAGEFIFGSTDWIRCKVCQIAIAQIALVLFSIHILALMSVDRYIFIKYPFKYYSIMSKRRVLLFTFVLWIFCFAVSLCPLFGFGDIHFGLTISTCKIRFDSSTNTTRNIYYGVFVVLETLLVPFPILFITNTLVIWTVQKHLRKLYANKKEVGYSHEEIVSNILKDFEKTKYKKQLQLIKTFGSILVGHLLTWTPVIVYIFRVAIIGHDNFTNPDNVFAYITFIFFPVLHPILEAYFIPEVRKFLLEIVSVLFCGYNRKFVRKCLRNCGQLSACKLCRPNRCSKMNQYINLLCLATLPVENDTI